MNTKISVNSRFHQVNDWLKELSFYHDEFKIFDSRLLEVAGKNTATEIMKDVEHFQNKFIILNERHDIIKHNLNETKSKLEGIALEKPTHLQEKSMEVDNNLDKEIEDFIFDFRKTRSEFNLFLSKYF